MGFKLVKLNKDKVETPEPPTATEPGIEEAGQGVMDRIADSTALAQAEEVAQRTKELLSTRGWCLWKCATLGGEVIAVVRDESVKGIPDGYPLYTEAELDELCSDDVSHSTLKLVHEAKKLAGAKVTTELQPMKRGN